MSEMVEANEIEITPAMIEAMEREYYAWWAENDHYLSSGLPGDVVCLRLRLNAAAAKSVSSDGSAPLDRVAKAISAGVFGGATAEGVARAAIVKVRAELKRYGHAGDTVYDERQFGRMVDAFFDEALR